MSRIFETLGVKVEDIPILWIAAPVTGLLVQPVVGYFSDRTWNRLGRWRPYFLVSNEAPGHIIPDSVRLSFYLGAAVFFAAVLWTILKS